MQATCAPVRTTAAIRSRIIMPGRVCYAAASSRPAATPRKSSEKWSSDWTTSLNSTKSLPRVGAQITL